MASAWFRKNVFQVWPGGFPRRTNVSEHFEEYDVVEGAEDARRALGELTGFDFIAATGPLTEEAWS
jgi:hypothetical protein